ncbi:MAG: Wzz/FepE/Etk N-terminal domain-containing protein [Candidatus Dormibacteria bacterium]
MEIRDYLRAIRRWLWLPIVVPLVAALITGFVLEEQPSKYEADATVIVPAVSAKGFSTSAAAQYVATFKDVLVSSPVVNKVAAENHVPAADLVNGLSADTITASSNIIHVSYLGYKGQNTTAIVNDASMDTLDTIAEPQLVQAQNAVSAANVQLQQANSAINNFNTSTGDILPQQQFNSEQQELDTLELELQQANLAGDTTHATALQAIITQRETQLATLAGQVNQYTTLSDARQAAISVSDHAAQELNDVESLVAADHASGTVAVQKIGRISKLSDTLKFTAIAFAVALALALGVILLLELMKGGRRQAGETTETSDTDADELGGVGPVVVGQFGGSEGAAGGRGVGELALASAPPLSESAASFGSRRVGGGHGLGISLEGQHHFGGDHRDPDLGNGMTGSRSEA